LTAVNIWFQTHGTHTVIREATLLERVLGAGAAIWFYLEKAVLPIDLSFVYPNWQISTNEIRWWLPLIATIMVTALMLWKRQMPWARALLFAWVAFCVALAPVLGFVDVGFMRYSLVADHYQYLSLVPVMALASAALWAWTRQASVGIRQAGWLLAAAAVAV